MPDWLKEWGTLAIAMVGAITGISSLVINGLNRRDAVRKEAKARKASEPWAELAGAASEKGFSMAVGFHNPSGRHFVIREARLEAPEGWHIVVYAPVYFVDPDAPRPSPKVVAAGRSISIEEVVGLPKPLAGSRAKTLNFAIEQIEESGPLRSAKAAIPISAAMRFTGAWISATAEPIDLQATITLAPTMRA